METDYSCINPATNRNARGHFVKGLPSANPAGRPKGIPSKPAFDLKKLAIEVLLSDDPQAYIDNVRERIFRGEAAHAEKIFLEHILGKPLQQVELSGQLDLVHILLDRLALAKDKALGRTA